jgi:hypothetical protein
MTSSSQASVPVLWATMRMRSAAEAAVAKASPAINTGAAPRNARHTPRTITFLPIPFAHA